ncbi:tetratricopeptide repeat protein, partial [Candidatus Latescibacterota bacterium]
KLQKQKNPVVWALVIVLVLIVIASGVYFFLHQQKQEPIEEPIRSIAVLPFRNMSADPEQEYFCDGLADDIILALTHVGELNVLARTSSFAFKGQDKDIRDIGRELEVDAVFEGSVSKSGNRLRINAQLINVTTGYHILTGQYDYEMEDALDIRDDICMRIVDELKINLGEKEKAAIEKRYTENVEADNEYKLGRYYLEMRTKEGVEQAFEHFTKAIEIDPDYALAYAGIADYYHYFSAFGLMPSKDAYPEAKKAAEKALELDNTLAEAYISLAIINNWYDWDLQSAKYNLDQALKYNPGNSRIYYRHLEYYNITRQFEKGIETLQRAIELDPLRYVLYWNLLHSYCHLEKYDEAWEVADNIEKIFPKEVDRHNYGRGVIYLYQGNYNDAIENFEKIINKRLSALTDIGYAYGMAGEKEKAAEIINKLKENSPLVSPFIAYMYLGMGENDKVFEWLETAYENREPYLILITWDPGYDNLRSDPRFIALLKKMGFPED